MSAKDLSRFEVLKVLSAEEIAELDARHRPVLRALRERYAPEVETDDGYRPQAEYLDLLRTAWLLDKRWFKPRARIVSRALGFAFGKLLSDALNMRWCEIRDGYGDTISMVFQDPSASNTRHSSVSFPPFNYVEKRERVRNAEVFVDGLKAAISMLEGRAT